MEIITGRLTANATINETKGGKQVVNFTTALNSGYRDKDGNYQEITSFVDCSYWLSAKAAQRLKKGVVVQLIGRIGISAYLKRNGEPAASLTFHVDEFMTLTKVPKDSADESQDNLAQLATAAAQGAQGSDDLPF